jgi:hypothetical protein
MEVTASLADHAIGVMRRVAARLEPVMFLKSTVDSRDGAPLRIMSSGVIKSRQ